MSGYWGFILGNLFVCGGIYVKIGALIKGWMGWKPFVEVSFLLRLCSHLFSFLSCDSWQVILIKYFINFEDIFCIDRDHSYYSSLVFQNYSNQNQENAQKSRRVHFKDGTASMNGSRGYEPNLEQPNDFGPGQAEYKEEARHRLLYGTKSNSSQNLQVNKVIV